VDGKGDVGSSGMGDGELLPEAVEEERRHHVEAAVVRIMKSRKVLSHNELVMETTRQLAGRFVPNPQVRFVFVSRAFHREFP
jgi:cullin 3